MQHQPSMSIDDILTKHRQKLNISRKELISLINNAMNDVDCESKLVELLGIENFEDIIILCKHKLILKQEILKMEFEELNFGRFDEIRFKAIKSRKTIQKDLVPISEVEDGSRYFKFEFFNMVQSKVFKYVYYQDDNLLISAPTGSGKTEIAILAILRANPSITNKIIYIAPMKALATEIAYKLQNMLKCTVCEFTGDTEFTSKDAARFSVFVCTPEKFEVVTRRHGNVFEKLIKLIIVDEIHILQDERGPVLESIICRIFSYIENQQRAIRILGLSATMPNIEDVAVFIKAKNKFVFDDSFRPVSLDISIVGVYGKRRKNGSRNVIAGNTEILDVCLEKIDELGFKVRKKEEEANYKDTIKTEDDKNIIVQKKENQYLVFTHSRHDTVATAKKIAENLPMTNSTKKVFDNGLFNDLYRKGVMVHHAGLPRHIRGKVEKQYLDGHIKILCCTSTLAWGVNLPANIVIIKGTSYYDPKKGGYVDIGILDVVQIFGRAGRPQFNNDGQAILITSRNKLETYVDLITEKKPIESQMLDSLIEVLNAEICLGEITNIQEALVYLKGTFLYKRMCKNPYKYGVIDEELDFVLRDYILLTLRKLETYGMIIIKREFGTKIDDSNTWNIYGTDIGRIASHFYVQNATINKWNEEIATVKTELEILDLMFKSNEFENVIFRADDFQIIKDLAEINNFEFEETNKLKLMVLTIAYFKKDVIHGFSLGCDQNYIIQNLERLLAAFLDFIVVLRLFSIFKRALHLLVQVRRKKQVEMVFNYDLEIQSAGKFYKIRIKSQEFGYKYLIIGINKAIIFFNDEIEFFVEEISTTFEIEIGDMSSFSYSIKTIKISDIVQLNFDDELRIYGLHRCIEVCSGLVNGIKSCPHFSLDDDEKMINDFMRIELSERNNIDLIANSSGNQKDIFYIILNIVVNLNCEVTIIVGEEVIKKQLFEFLNIQSQIRGKKIPKNNIQIFAKINKKELKNKIILSGCRNKSGLYPISDIIDLTKNKDTIIIEKRDYCEFLSYLYNL